MDLIRLIEERITAKGYGIKTPTLDRPQTEAEKAECRKVEVRIAGQGMK